MKVKSSQAPGATTQMGNPKSNSRATSVATAAMKRRVAMLEGDVRSLQSELAEISRQKTDALLRANHDTLTALPNRDLLVDRFLQAAAQADRKQKAVAVLFFDLDRFKRVNDEFGHSVGDKVLQVVARRIQETIRAIDTACRYGGDEFVVILTELEDAGIAEELVEKILRRLAQPYPLGEKSITLASSAGVAIYPRDGAAWETVMCFADAEMYRAKRHRGSTEPNSWLPHERSSIDVCG